jgi:hypothetical protein
MSDDPVRALLPAEWMREAVLANALAYWGADRAGAEALADAMAAAKARHRHREAMASFHVFDWVRRDADRATAIDELAEAMVAAAQQGKGRTHGPN